MEKIICKLKYCMDIFFGGNSSILCPAETLQISRLFGVPACVSTSQPNKTSHNQWNKHIFGGRKKFFLIFIKKYLFLAKIQIGNIFGKSTNLRWVLILKQVPQPVYDAQMPVLCFFGTISTWTKFIQKKSHQILPFHVELYW